MDTNVLAIFGFRWRYYIRHPIQFFNRCRRNLRNAWMRVTKGWCYDDVWEMGEHLMKIIPEMLETMADKGCGYPGTGEFIEPDAWSEYLKETARLFRNASGHQNVQQNEYEDEFHYQSELKRQRKQGENLGITMSRKLDDAGLNKLFKLYLKRSCEIAEWRASQKDEAMSRLSHILFNLVD